MFLGLIRTYYGFLNGVPSDRMLDRIQPGINFLYPCHAIRKPNRIIIIIMAKSNYHHYHGLEMRKDRGIKNIRVSDICLS
jgi:hypothetical protein